ncbi:MAG: glycosyltransferase, partial [Wenzhouxiangellaceae bacterium]|nr:glycosyltransferase [Wenzhouxiangellaceae bacterium]
MRLLVLSSTYPRSEHDPEPGFVHELARRLTDAFEVRVIGPHATGAALREQMDGVDITRFRYAPSKLETLVNDGGIVTNLKRNPIKWLLVPAFLFAQTWTTWQTIRTWRPDVIHAHWLIPQGLIVALLGRVSRKVPPFLVTSHGADLFALRFWPMPAVKRFVTRRAAAVTVVSQAMLKALEEQGISTENATVQPMGVDLTERYVP